LVLFNRLKLGTPALLAVVFAAGAGIVSFEFAGGRDASRAVASSSDDPPVSGVAALGRIEPQSGLMNVSAATPDVLETLLVQRGDLVEKDQVLGFLQSHAEQVAQRDSIAAQLDEAKARLIAEEELCQAQIENAEIKLRRVEDLTPSKL
jgi:multidrug efflux pump subunit AcrA (membrane-fusion protein)